MLHHLAEKTTVITRMIMFLGPRVAYAQDSSDSFDTAEKIGAIIGGLIGVLFLVRRFFKK
jgi:hypothetical protein